MKVESITLREVRMILRQPFVTHLGVAHHRGILLVEVIADGARGFGEITAWDDPFYSPETLDTAWHVVRAFIAPMLLGRQLATATEAAQRMARIRGHQMARAGVESALWDIEAQQRGVSLAALVGGQRAEVASGVALGLQSSTDELLSRIAAARARGYQRVKLKIERGRDIEVVRAVRDHHGDIPLMVDANSGYALADADHLQRLDEFDLMMIEQPLGWDDLVDHARLQARIATPVCLDESIDGEGAARAAIALRACRVVNIKLGRVGGHTAARRIHDLCREAGIPVWCGGMLESGIGRAHNIALATLPGFTLPGDISASRRYFERDIIDPEVEVTPKGTVEVPTTSGLGYRVRTDMIENLTARREVWTVG